MQDWHYISYSSLGTYSQCPFKFKLSKIDNLKTLFDCDPMNPLVLGRTFHRGIETDIQTAIKEYFDEYPIIEDQHIREAVKLEKVLTEAKNLLPDGLHEVQIQTEDYLGYIDLLVPVGNNTFDLYDFKYAKTAKYYIDSQQLHVYKHYFELANPDKRIRRMFYLFASKIDLTCEVMPIDFDPIKVEEFQLGAEELRNATEFPKNESRLCRFCEFKDYCKKGHDYMILPDNKREERPKNSRKKVYIYGAPFTGKTYLANDFPNVLFLSTDGNYTNLPNGIPPHVDIKDHVTVDGRVTRRTYAWEIFKDTLVELEKKQNTFETIVIDLVEDLYEACRQYIFQKYNIQHESDSGFGKGWDLVKTEFLTQMKKFFMLDYPNLIAISHENISEDLTRRSGDRITKVKPNIADKIANKLAGMTDLVIRTLNEDETYLLSFKNDEVTFGGGRLKVSGVRTIPASYEELCKVYEQSNN